jgi:hypothetical protein
MLKILLMLLLSVVSSSAMAEWTKIYDGENSTQYIDYSTVRNAGDIVKFSQLTDLKRGGQIDNGKPTLSIKSQNEIDCKKEKKHDPYAIWSTMGRGEGEVVDTSPLDVWVPISPGTLYWSLLESLCGKK